MTETFALTARAMDKARLRRGERVLIIGDGPVTQALATATADREGLPSVVENAPETLVGVAIIFVATGEPSTIAAVLERAPRFARIILVTSVAEATTDVDFYRTVHLKCLELVGVSLPASA